MKLLYTPFQVTKNFHITEFYCKDYKKTPVPHEYLQNAVYLAVQLQKIRDFLKLDLLKINSGYRTPFHNSKINGSSSSNHLTAYAADLVQYNLKNDNFHLALKQLIDQKFIPDGELIKYETFVHYAPQYDVNHLPQKHVPLYPDLEKHQITYNKDMNHAKFQKLQTIRETFNTIKTK